MYETSQNLEFQVKWEAKCEQLLDIDNGSMSMNFTVLLFHMFESLHFQRENGSQRYVASPQARRNELRVGTDTNKFPRTRTKLTEFRTSCLFVT